MDGLEHIEGLDLLTPDMLMRRIIFDAFEDPVAIVKLAGLMPDSEDGNAAEQRASEARLTAVGALIPALSKIAAWNAAIATKIQIAGQEEKVSPKFAHDMEEMFFSLAQSSMISVISNFMDLGLLQIGPAVG